MHKFTACVSDKDHEIEPTARLKKSRSQSSAHNLSIDERSYTFVDAFYGIGDMSRAAIGAGLKLK